jgi:predicted DNA-binding protein (MmcQ/YjbR family)
MRLLALRAFALGLPHATVVQQWGNNLVFKVAGKMFLIIAIDGQVIETLSFKCSPAEFKRLSDVDGVIPAPYLARASWVQVQDLAALPTTELERRIRTSYDLVYSRLPQKIRIGLK